MRTSISTSIEPRLLARVVFWLSLLCAGRGASEQAPASPDHPWHSSVEKEFQSEGQSLRTSAFSIAPDKSYSLAALIDLAEMQNPETRFAWERARAEAAALGVAQSELYPALAVTAISQLNRGLHFSGISIDRQTIQSFEGGLDLSYTVFDFGARASRISAAKAEVLAENFAFNDAHRRTIHDVEQAYYQLLNASGQLQAAEASLTNAQAVHQAAEDRLEHGLATLPDVLEAQSAEAQAEYELQAVAGAEDIARGNLAKALGMLPTLRIHVQPLDQLATPESLSDNVEKALDRAFQQRPDLMQQLAEVRSANARVKEAGVAFYPTLNLDAAAGGQALYASQEAHRWVHSGNWVGGVGLSLTWSLFDGGLRKSKLARAKADVRASQATVNAARDAIADEVWTAYSNLRTAFRQRQSASALLSAADQSYAASLDSYNHGVRNLLDVTAAQRRLAQARSSDVLARTQVLASVAELAFRTGDSIQPTAKKSRP
jgi:outer membrane protein